MTKPNDSNQWRLAFLLCASLVACQSVFGDYKAGQLDGGVTSGVGGSTATAGAKSTAGNTSKAGNASSGGTSSGGATADTSCGSDGIHRCTDTSVDTCVDHQWQALLSCSRDLCDSDRGRCMACSPGATRCSAFNLQTCASTGDNWTTTKACDTADYCDSVTNKCFACLSGEAFCSGASLYKCNANQDGWTVTDCNSPDLCDARAQTCGDPCPNSDWVSCNGRSLIGCDGNGHHIQLDECASSQLCQRTLDDRASNPTGWNGKCSTGCTPGAYQCNPDNPSELRACPPSGVGWEHVEPCGPPELGNAADLKCETGCGVPPGTYRCNGAQLELCRADGTAFELLKTCQDASHCNTQKRDCVACVPGEYHCSGSTLQTCTSSLTWSTVKSCASAALCNATQGTCIDPGCTRAGAYQCSGAVLQQCRTDLTAWADVATCVTSTLCDAANGRCKDVKCDYPGDYRCQGNTRQICDEATRDWKDVNTCTSNQACDLTASTGCRDTCPEPPARCNTVSGQTDAQVCTMVDGRPKWTTVATCATSALCSAGDAGALCNPPVCAANQYSCDGQSLLRCATGRHKWDVVKTCAAGQLCDSVGGQCDVCTPNTYSCNSILQLQKCTADGQFMNVVDNCPSVADCYTSADRLTGYCYRCASGAAQCDGSTRIRTCAADRRGWNPATSCANGCQDNAGDFDYCAACPIANEVSCVETGAPGSTRKCAADRSAWGNPTTCTEGHGCVDDGTADYCAGKCEPNSAECVGTGRHVCAADGETWGATLSECADTRNLRGCVDGQFSGTVACLSDAPYCVNGRCVECTGTTTECSGSNSLRTCDEGRWVTSTCPSATPICAGNACVECTSASTPTCSNGTTRRYCASNNTWATSACTGETPYCQGGSCVECPSSYTPTCASNNAVQSCANGELVTTNCSGNTPVCYAGSAGAVCAACNANTTPDCLPDGVTRRTCVNGAYATTLCSGENASYCLYGACAGCNANSPARCTSNTALSTCNTSTGSWVETECPTATPVCTGAPGRCVECAPDSAWVCTGSSSRRSCTDGRNIVEPCATGQICDPADATCKAPTCAANEYQCSGNVLQKCNGTRTGWDTMQTCPAACYSGACVACTPNSTVCASTTGIRTCAADGSGYGATLTECADGTSLKTCLEGVFSGSTPCPTDAPICSNGQCMAAVCEVGERRCLDGIPQLCNASRTGWDSLAACTGATPVCQASTGTCGCSTPADCAGTPETPICSTATNRCVAPVCDPNERQCAGNVQQICNASRTGWEDETTCAGVTPVCQPSTGRCGCSESAQCADTTETPICFDGQCVAPTCAIGQRQCSSTGIPQLCNETRTGWVNETPCAGITPICQTDTGTCGCADSAECTTTPATPYCNTTSGTCVACLTSADCGGTTPICNSGQCAACSEALVCPAGACQQDGSCLVSAPG